MTDSEPEAEYSETLAKGEALARTIGATQHLLRYDGLDKGTGRA